jgi:hypothetical protein
MTLLLLLDLSLCESLKPDSCLHGSENFEKEELDRFRCLGEAHWERQLRFFSKRVFFLTIIAEGSSFKTGGLGVRSFLTGGYLFLSVAPIKRLTALIGLADMSRPKIAADSASDLVLRISSASFW